MLETDQNLLRPCANPDCGLEFAPRRAGQKYHTEQCRKRHWRRLRELAVSCPHCGRGLLASLSLRSAGGGPARPGAAAPVRPRRVKRRRARRRAYLILRLP